MAGDFSGLGMGLGNLSRLSKAQTRSISAESFTGEKGSGGRATEGAGAVASRELGQGWKVSPCIHLGAELQPRWRTSHGPGAIQQIWMTVTADRLAAAGPAHVLGRRGHAVRRGADRRLLLQRLVRALQHHLAAGRRQPGRRFNCYFEMPFRRHARITVENLSPDEVRGFYYQINYTLTGCPTTAPTCMLSGGAAIRSPT